MFENLKAAIQDILQGRVAPVDRRAAIADMKRALVSAKLGVSDLREGVEITKQRLDTERNSLETVVRRKALAASIPDAETVAIAEKFEAQHTQRIAVLEQKLAAQEAELGMVESDYDEMLKALKSADRGVGGGLNAESAGPTDADLGLPDDAGLNSQLDALKRQSRRSDANAAADAKLEELKRRMGQQAPE
jgi:hypothetical protein